jgi:6,7-dimethyl-8-ribityllumazine synthase
MLPDNKGPCREKPAALIRNLCGGRSLSFLLLPRLFMPLEISASSKHAELPPNQSIGIIVSTYNSHITEKLCEGAIATLTAGGISEDRIVVVRVPGAWELPFAVQRLIAVRSFAGAIALGAVIKGETSHDQHINRAVSNTLMQLSMDHNKPIAFGLLTVNSLEQAIQRSGGNKGNKGEECATALLECLRLGTALDRMDSLDT